MSRYLAGRILAGVVTLVVFATLLFFLADLLMPGDFATRFTLEMSDAQLAQLREYLGLDRPLLERYLDYMGGLATGDLGLSYWGVSVASLLWALLPWTLMVFVIAMGISFPVGFWVGKHAAWRSSGTGSGLTIGSVALHTTFPPLLVFLLVFLTAKLTSKSGITRLQELFASGELTSQAVWRMLAVIAVAAAFVAVAAWLVDRSGRSVPTPVWGAVVVAAPVLFWLATGTAGTAFDVLRYLALPILAVTLLAVGEVVLVTKATTGSAKKEDFVLTARAKGLDEPDIRDHHAGRYALLPTLSKLAVSVPFVLAGLIIIEVSFGWPNGGELGLIVPGLSSMIFTALEQRDIPVVVGALFAIGLIMLAIRLILDVVQAALDPRIRFQRGGA
jgi:peptide/nickel transport system permease protein